MTEPVLHPIEAAERTLSSIFSDAYAFEIPPYQRPYAWESEQANELLDDLLSAMDDKTTSGGVYFLGSIVLIKKPGSSDAKVVDGQQRLTTLTILLSVLRDLTTDARAKIKREEYVFQAADADKGTVDRFRLLLRQRDQEFFESHVQRPGATDNLPPLGGLAGSQARIVENALLYRDRLGAIEEERRNRLIAFVIQYCYLVVVAVPTPEAARRIFTVLNARGLDLTATDILKAELLERAGSTKEAALATRWEAIELSLGRDRFVELFGHIRMVYERDKPRSALETGFPEHVTPFRGDAGKFVTDVLEPYADAMLLLENQPELERRFGQDAAFFVRSLEGLDNKDWVAPALMQLRRAAADGGIDVGRFLHDLERVAYYLFVTRRDATARSNRYADVMDSLDGRRAPKSAALNLSAAECLAFREALDGPLYKKSRVCKPVLVRLDAALSAGGARYEKIVSIEHVLPQSVDTPSYWATQFPDEESRDDWTHRLGNLVLLTRRINSAASNWDFETKKTKYFNTKQGRSPFPLTQTVLDEHEWNTERLESRQRKLLDKLAEVWRLNESVAS